MATVATHIPPLKARPIINAVNADDFRRFSAWKDLSALVERIEFDGVYVDTDTLAWEDGERFSVDVEVDVGLYYGPDMAEASSFPGRLTGHLVGDDKKVVIDEITVDTRGVDA